MGGRLSGKVAVISGASRGLGQYCAIAYAAEGAKVVAAARSTAGTDLQASLVTAHEAIRAAGGEVIAMNCDVADPGSIREMVQAALERFGRIDVLMTNAVYYAGGGLMTIDPGDWEAMYRVNVHGVFHAIRAVAPAMIAQGGGAIITISSVAAQKGSPYGTTKRAVLGLTLGLADELAPHGVAVNSLRPVAAIATPGWRMSRPPAALAKRAHRVSPPDSYVEAATLLAMQPAACCTGQDLTDAQVIKMLGDPQALERFKASNAPIWSEGL